MRAKDIVKFKELMRLLGFEKKINQALFKSDGGGGSSLSEESDPVATGLIGVLGNLLTTTKNTVVDSINEIYSTFRKKTEQLIVVDVTGNGDFVTIGQAIASISNATAQKPYTVLCNPGVYTENPITIPSYVTLKGVNKKSVTIVPVNNGATLFTMSTNSAISNLTIESPKNTNSGSLAQTVYGDNVEFWAEDLNLIGFTDTTTYYDGGIRVKNASGIAHVKNVYTLNHNQGLRASDGATMYCDSTEVQGSTYMYVATTGSVLHLKNIKATDGGYGIYNDTSKVFIENYSAEFLYTALRARSNSYTYGTSINNHHNESYDIWQESSTAYVEIQGLVCDGNTDVDPDILPYTYSLADATKVKINVGKDSEKLGGQLPSYYQVALGYTPVNVDQTNPQTIINGVLIFDKGIQSNGDILVKAGYKIILDA